MSIKMTTYTCDVQVSFLRFWCVGEKVSLTATTAIAFEDRVNIVRPLVKQVFRPRMNVNKRFKVYGSRGKR